MWRAIGVMLVALFGLALSACAGEAQVVERIVTVEVEKVVEKVVVREVPVEKVVTVEVVKVVTVEKEVVVEKEIVVEVEKILIATPTPPPSGEPQFGGTLRITAQGSISALDPIFSFFYVTQAISSHIYEGLFGWDNDLEVQPRGIESWSVSADGLVYTFTLRDMLFHDGTPFKSEDAIASVNRWRDSGNAAAGVVRRFTADDALQQVDDKTFTWTMDEPLGAAIFILGLPSENANMMRVEEAANVPFSEPVEIRIGTGAYRFADWDFGNQVVIERFGEYDSRSEPSGLGAYAGENIAYIDRIIWIEVPDVETKMAGLETGEWDVVDGASLDFFERASNDPDIQVPLYKPGIRSDAFLNPQIPPFSSQKARQAIMTAIKVEDIMSALGDPALWLVCPALYWCGTPLETDAGSRYTVETSAGPREIGYNVNDVETAKLLLADSDYAGETTVLLNPTDYATITPTGHVLKPIMEEVGFTVEMPALDWATITSKFGSTDTWSAATSWYEQFCCGNPIQDFLIAGTIDFVLRDDVLLKLQLDFARELDAAKRFAIVEAIQTRRYEVVVDLTFGTWFPIYPMTIDLKNFEVQAMPYYINTWLER